MAREIFREFEFSKFLKGLIRLNISFKDILSSLSEKEIEMKIEISKIFQKPIKKETISRLLLRQLDNLVNTLFVALDRPKNRMR